MGNVGKGWESGGFGSGTPCSFWAELRGGLGPGVGVEVEDEDEEVDTSEGSGSAWDGREGLEDSLSTETKSEAKVEELKLGRRTYLGLDFGGGALEEETTPFLSNHPIMSKFGFKRRNRV